jgi:DNA-binding NarL/FixJ family response regulator
VRALVVEDNAGWQEILAEILADMGLAVDVAGDFGAASAQMIGARHRLAVVDLSLKADDEGNQEGLQVLAALRQNDPACTALLLTGFATVEIAVAALKEFEAWTCLRKETFRRAEFKDAVRQILALPVPEDPLATLTPREREVMALLVQGLPNKGIAHSMVISENTVKRYLKAIFEKLDVDSRAAAVAKVLGGHGT